MKQIDKNKSKKIIGLVVAVIAVIAAVTIGVFASRDKGNNVSLQELLDTGAKYLAELDYEQAIAVYREAIALEPKSVDAYLGLAEAYLGLGDLDAVRKVLEDGYAATGDEIFQDWITAIWESEPEDMEEERPEVDDFGRKLVYFDMDMYYEDVAAACTVDEIPLVSYDFETLRADYVSRFPDTHSNEDGSYISHSNKELFIYDAGYISRNADGAETIMMNDGDTGTKLQISLSQGGYAVLHGEVNFVSETGLVNRVSSWLGAPLEEFLEYYLPGSYAS